MMLGKTKITMTLPRWWEDGRQKQNSLSKQQELARAKQTKGKRQPGSGSSRYARHDVKTEDFLEELKFTASGHFTIKASDWLRLRKNSLLAGRQPKLVVDFHCLERPEKEKFRLVVIEERIE